MRKNFKKTLMITSALGLIHPLRATAQNDDFLPPPPPPPAFEDFPTDDFGAPPMNPMPIQANPSSNSNSGSMGTRSAGTPAATNNSDKFKIPNRSSTEGGQKVLNDKQKLKFSNAGAEDITNDNFPETIESFDFPNAEITDVIKAISELTGKNFIIEPSVRGKITIVAPSKITVAEAYKAFLSALAINSFTVVPSGNFLKIKNSRAATRDNIETYSGAYYPNTDQMITRIVHLKHISAEQVNRELRMFNTKDGEMNPYPPTNSIIISDYGTAIDRFMKVISQLDVPGFEEQLVVIPIKFAKAKDLADLIDKIVNKGGRGGASGGVGGAPGAFNAGVPRFSRGGTGTSSQQGASFFMSIPDDRTNSIIVTGNKSGIDRIRKLVEKLDFRLSPEDAGGVNVYYVKHGDAKKIAQTLQGVTKDGQSNRSSAGNSPFAPIGPGGFGASQTEIFGGDVKIQADETTNSLVITASKQDYATVLDILRKIDIASDQVYVEAIISELGLEDGANWGVGYYKFGDSGYGKAGFNSGVDIGKVLNPIDSSAGSILTFASGGPLKMKSLIPGQTGNTIEVPSIVGFINLLKETSKLNVLSTPQIMALDNQEATLSVGTKIPTSQGGASTANGVTTAGGVNYEDANIELKLKPFINPTSNTVRMEIDQSLKQPVLAAAAPEALRSSALAIAQRRIKTNIVVTNGDTAVLGGLIQDRETEEIKKVPLLGDIPILGWLFKGSTKKISKINLLIFLTPKIVRNPANNAQILNSKLDERREGVKDIGGKDPFGKRMDKLTSRNSLVDDGSAPSPKVDDTAPQEFVPEQDQQNQFEDNVEEAPLYE